MSEFKDIIHEDVSDVFINPDEFSDMHVINGLEMPAQFDENEQVEREKRRIADGKDTAGVYNNQKLLYVKADDFGAFPAIGQRITIDDGVYSVVDALDEVGIYTITLKESRTTQKRGVRTAGNILNVSTGQ